MGILDEIAPVRSTHSSTKGSSRLDLILGDLEALPKTKEFPQEDFDRLLAMLLAPVSEWSHAQLVQVLRQVCAALGVDDRDINRGNLGDWRGKQRNEL